VPESRRKNAECNHKREEIEAKVPGEALLRTPQRECKVNNSIACQKSPGQLNSIGKLPTCAESYGLERGQYMFKI
jgi:hypothetical protein